jgi:hypothetical protein
MSGAALGARSRVNWCSCVVLASGRDDWSRPTIECYAGRPEIRARHTYRRWCAPHALCSDGWCRVPALAGGVARRHHSLDHAARELMGRGDLHQPIGASRRDIAVGWYINVLMPWMGCLIIQGNGMNVMERREKRRQGCCCCCCRHWWWWYWQRRRSVARRSGRSTRGGTRTVGRSHRGTFWRGNRRRTGRQRVWVEIVRSARSRVIQRVEPFIFKIRISKVVESLGISKV